MMLGSPFIAATAARVPATVCLGGGKDVFVYLREAEVLHAHYAIFARNRLQSWAWTPC